MSMRIVFVLCLMLVLARIAPAQTASAGKDLFTAKCVMCHGADGSANTTMDKSFKIRNFHSPDVQKQSDAQLTVIITKGRGNMPSFDGKLTTDQISQLVAYIRELGKQK